MLNEYPYIKTKSDLNKLIEKAKYEIERSSIFCNELNRGVVVHSATHRDWSDTTWRQHSDTPPYSDFSKFADWGDGANC